MPKTMWIELVVVLSLLAAGTALFRLTDIDMQIESRLHDASVETNGGWVHADDKPWKCLYHFGNLPALLLSVAALVVFALGFRFRKLLSWRKIALFLVVVMLIGPGLIINMVFKDHWGRPRPREVIELGGDSQFEPVWDKGVSGKGKSFPCGHCSMGFYLIVPWFVLRRKKPVLASAVLAAGLAIGGLTGVARMAQGGHFASDTLWSGGFVYLTAMGVFYFMRLDRGIWYDGVAKKNTLALWLMLPLTLVLILLVMLATPYYRRKELTWRGSLPPRVQRFEIDAVTGDVSLAIADSIEVRFIAQGFGLPDVKLRYSLLADTLDTGVAVVFRQWKTGWFTELQNDIEAALPVGRVDTLRIFTADGDIRLEGAAWSEYDLVFSPPVDGWDDNSRNLESNLHDRQRIVILWEAPRGQLVRVMGNE